MTLLRICRVLGVVKGWAGQMVRVVPALLAVFQRRRRRFINVHRYHVRDYSFGRLRSSALVSCPVLSSWFQQKDPSAYI